MIYFLNKDLCVVDKKNEISFSFSKKANREGSGKIEIADMPNKESFYISVYEHTQETFNSSAEDQTYIISGFIQEVQLNSNSVSISFSTFEGLLKKHKLPKIFSNFNEMKASELFANLFYFFVPIIKSKKKDFTYNKGLDYGLNAEYTNGVLKADHIEFAKVKDGDLHLAFDSQHSSQNEFRYFENGQITFWFDLGYQQQYILDIEGKRVEEYPKRFLRFTASLGSKTIINVKAITQNSPFTKENTTQYMKALKEAPYLGFDRSIKDFEKNVGVELPSEGRFVAIQFIFIYEKPDWINDYSTLNVYDNNDRLVKRTVRGFTPVLHGFEILNRRNIAPFFSHGDATKQIYIYEDDIEKPFYSFNSKVKFDGLSLYEAMVKFLDATKYKLKIDLTVGEYNNLDIKLSQYDFSTSSIDVKKNAYIKGDHILRLHEGEASRLNNYLLKAIKKKTQFTKILHCYGAGDGQDVLYACLFNEFINNSNGSLQERYILYSPTEIDNNSDVAKILKQLEIVQKKELPELNFYEETFEDSNIKTFNELLVKAKEYLINEKKKEDFSFEIESDAPCELYDKVLLIHQKSEVCLKADIVEIKINVSASNKKKTFGIGGFLYNPFDSLFQKPQIAETVLTPLQPFNVRAFTQDGKINIVWDCLGENDGYIIEAWRLDKEVFSRARPDYKVYFHTNIKEISLFSFDEKTLYAFVIYSYIGKNKSNNSIVQYFKINKDNTPIKILNSLNENGSKKGERGFFLDINNRNNKKVKREILNILGLQDEKKLNKLNDISETFFIDALENVLEVDVEKVKVFLGKKYIWDGEAWVDEEIRKPNKMPIFYFNFKDNNVSSNYNTVGCLATWNTFWRLKEYEECRQWLCWASNRYILPEGSDTPIQFFSLGGGIEKPIVAKGLPNNDGKPKKPIEPPPPFNGDFDKPDYYIRQMPPQAIKEMWEEKKQKYDEMAKDLVECFRWFSSQNYNHMKDILINGKFFDLSPFENHIEFNTNIFSFERGKEKYFYSDRIFIDSVCRFYWQSTIADGRFNWIWNKPFFQIAKLNNFQDGVNYKEHTLSFWFNCQGVTGEVELWNIGNYNIGIVRDGMLYFGFKHEGVFYPLYNMPLYVNLSFFHILIKARFLWLRASSNYHIRYSQKIYFDFTEVPKSKYESGKNYKEFSSDSIDGHDDFLTLFNFNKWNSAEENYYKKDFESVKKSPFFDIRIAHLLMFDYWLDYGEFRFLQKNPTYPIKKEKKIEQKNTENVVMGKPQKDSKYKGFCISNVEKNKNEVLIYDKEKITFKNDEFFLMARNIEGFTAGVLYAWVEKQWQELLPYSLYPKEYVMAYNDILSMKNVCSDISFADFVMNSLQVSDVIYSKTLQTNELTVKENIFIDDIKDEDPHIKGVLYMKYDPRFRGKYLTISEG